MEDSCEKFELERVLNVLSEGIILLDDTFKIVYTNEIAATFLGSFCDELRGKVLHDMHNFSIRGELKKTLEHLIKGEISFWEKTVYLNERFLNFQAKVITQEGIDRKGTVISIHDVTNLKKSKQSHDNLYRMYNLMADNIQLSMYTIDSRGLITSFNHATEKLWGIKKTDAINKPLIDIFFSGEKFEDNGEYKSPTIETLETGKEFHGLQKQLDINEKKYIVLFDTCILRDPTGNVLGVMAVEKDITEYTLGINEAYRLEKYEIITQLAAGLADEMRNPLTSVKGFMQLIQSRMRKNQQKEYMDLALDELKRIEQIVRNFLLFSSPDSPSLKLASINRIIEEVVTNYKINSSNIDFELSVPHEEFFMCIDEDQIRQVIINILQNSVEAIREQGSIKVTIFLEEDKPRVGVSIEDNGEGIEKDRWPHVFEPFYTNKEFNSGLGLTIAERIVNSHGGSIQGMENTLGGVTILVSLPFAVYPV